MPAAAHIAPLLSEQIQPMHNPQGNFCRNILPALSSPFLSSSHADDIQQQHVPFSNLFTEKSATPAKDLQNASSSSLTAEPLEDQESLKNQAGCALHGNDSHTGIPNIVFAADKSHVLKTEESTHCVKHNIASTESHPEKIRTKLSAPLLRSAIVPAQVQTIETEHPKEASPVSLSRLVRHPAAASEPSGSTITTPHSSVFNNTKSTVTAISPSISPTSSQLSDEPRLVSISSSATRYATKISSSLHTSSAAELEAISTHAIADNAMPKNLAAKATAKFTDTNAAMSIVHNSISAESIKDAPLIQSTSAVPIHTDAHGSKMSEAINAGTINAGTINAGHNNALYVQPHTSSESLSIIKNAHTLADTTPREPFAALDKNVEAHLPQWTHTTNKNVEAGYEDPTLGWISVRAEAGREGIHASLSANSSEAAQILGSHIVGLGTYLTDRHTPVETISISTLVNNSEADLRQNSGRQSSQHEKKQIQILLTERCFLQKM